MTGLGFKSAFDPAAPLGSFEPPAPPRPRRRPRSVALLFVAVPGGGPRYVIKSYREPGEDEPPGVARAEREIAAARAFEAAGAAALAPCHGPCRRLEILVDGWRTRVDCALVFPFIDAPTLYHARAEASDPTPLIGEAARRIAARHHRADDLAAIHSDGGAHNVFSSWVWLDFTAPHQEEDLEEAKAHEVGRFLESLVELSRGGLALGRARAFCEAYGDRAVLGRALARLRPRRPTGALGFWARMLERPHRALEVLLRPTKSLRRVRTWYALERLVGAGVPWHRPAAPLTRGQG